MSCAYCCGTATTRDHVPPVGFYPRPRPSDLITVPCCRECNQRFAVDDEYVQAVLHMRDDVSRSPAAVGLLDRTLRALRRTEADRFNRALSDDLTTIPLVTPSGLYLGTRDTLQVDKARMSGFISRLVRGLGFHTWGQAVPEHFRVRPSLGLEQNRGLLDKFRTYAVSGTVRWIGDRVFGYAWNEAGDSPMSSIWLLVFYDLVPFGAVVVDPAGPTVRGVRNGL